MTDWRTILIGVASFYSGHDAIKSESEKRSRYQSYLFSTQQWKAQL